ncbi:MAG: redoxin family protein [bacterium]
MYIPFQHPSADALHAFALGDLNEHRRRSLQGHLTECASCRADIVATRDILEQSASMAPSVSLRADAFSRVLAARASGTRVVLPVEPASYALPATFPWRAALAATLAVIVFGGLVRASLRRELVAAETSGHLVFSPQAPSDGAHVTVQYEAPANLTRYETLVLRVRYRTRWDEEYEAATRQLVATRLTRRGSQSFEGAFDLPSGVVYAALAVEDTAGTRVDANHGRLWELLVYQDGKPSEASLIQQYNDVLGRSPDSALIVVRTRSSLYPDSPGAWAGRVSHESFMLGATYYDSAVSGHLKRFAALDKKWRSRASVPPEVMDGMRSYYSQISDSAPPEFRTIARYWRKRFMSEAVGSPLRSQEQISDWNSRALKDSTIAGAVLDSAEASWQRGDSLLGMYTLFGLQIAGAAKDSAAVLRWTDRTATRMPAWAVGLTTQLGADPRFRNAALVRIREQLAHLSRRDDAMRPLEASIRQDSLRRAAASRSALAALGELLLTSGDTTSAIDTLGKAIADGWDRALFSRTAGVYLARHDTGNAARTFALIVSDPSTPVAEADSIRRRFTRAIGADAWQRLEGIGKQELARRVLATAELRPAPARATLLTERRDSVDLASLTRGKVSVVVVWSRFCGASRLQLPLYGKLQNDLSAKGIAFVRITEEASSPDLRDYLAASKVEFQTYYDARGEARRAFNNNATPTYYVLDSRGRIRFADHSPALALTQAAAVQLEQ